jgi:hypothetical protein
MKDKHNDGGEFVVVIVVCEHIIENLCEYLLASGTFYFSLE